MLKQLRAEDVITAEQEAENGEKQSKMQKLEISAEKPRQFDYFYDVEGENIELSQLTVNWEIIQRHLS